MAAHGSQFFASEASGRRRGEAAFEAELKRPDIRHARARIAHPQANGKTGRAHRKIERHLHEFEAEASLTSTRSDLPGGHHNVGGPFHSEGPRDPIDLFVHWHNHEGGHMSLDEGETPAMAYARRMPPGGDGDGLAVGSLVQAWVVVDGRARACNSEQSRISYRRGGGGGR